MLLGFSGLICLAIYTASIGGLGVLILQAAAFRGSNPPVITRFAFLKTLSPLVMAGAILLYAVRSRAHVLGLRRRWTVTFVAFLAGSFLILFHQAGRFTLAMFLLTFPLAKVVRVGRLRLRWVLVVGAITFVFLLFGKQLFQATTSQDRLAERVERYGHESAQRRSVGDAGFAFPSVVLANTSLEVPDVVEFRWFYDFPLAIEYLVPQRLLGVEHPLTVSMINSTRFPAFGAIPVDLVSFGFYSAWVPGVLVVLAAFGALLAHLERLLPAGPDPFDCVRRAAWIIFACSRVMYGDPQLVQTGGLHLIAMEILLLSTRILAERRNHPRASIECARLWLDFRGALPGASAASGSLHSISEAGRQMTNPGPEPAAGTPDENALDTLMALVATALRYRQFAVGLPAFLVFITIVVTLMARRTYTATTSFLPQSE